MASTVMDTTTLQAQNYTTTWDATVLRATPAPRPSRGIPALAEALRGGFAGH
jgi:hypothetical protein